MLDYAVLNYSANKVQIYIYNVSTCAQSFETNKQTGLRTSLKYGDPRIVFYKKQTAAGVQYSIPPMSYE